LSFDERSDRLPRIFHVNWFRQDAAGHFLWPGFGENLRVLQWIIDRCEKRVGARKTPIGYLPERDDIDTRGLEIAENAMDALLSVNVEQWQREMASVGEYLAGYGDRLPKALKQEHSQVVRDLQQAAR
jgi:phosphoenolpyruvate carboxykinase (GTP)